MPLDISTSITLPGLPSNIPLWDEGVKDHLTRKSSMAIRKMRCLWPNRYYIAQLLRGNTSASFSYVPPMAYPDAPWMYVDEVEMDGAVGTDPATGRPTGLVLGPNGMVGYKYALLSITYRTPDWLVDQQLGSLAVDVSTQFITVPSNGAAVFKFAASGNDCTDPPSIPITTIEFSRTINQVPSLPIVTAMTAAKSPINSVPFTLPTSSAAGSFAGSTTAPPGFVLYGGMRSQRAIDSYGNENWSVTHKFRWRSIPWDAAINPSPTASGSGSGGYVEPIEQLVYKANGNPIIARSDLTALLSPSAT